MLLTLLGIYLAVWGCAYASARAVPGLPAYWGFYALAVLGAPNLLGGLFYLLYRGTDAPGASGFSASVVLLGMALAALSYPLNHARLRRRR